MKALLLAAALLGASGAALAQTSVHLDIGQPGFYGSIDIGDSRPRLVYERPIIVERPVRYIAEPMYLRVPPGHRKHWSKHCYRYGACGRNVYFVRDDWYQNEWAPRYREQHGYAVERRYVEPRRPVRVVERVVEVDRGWDDRDHDRGHGGGHGHGRGHGEGHGHGHGHGQGKH
ncbi:MAG: hypothetical protein ACLGI6_06160 [Gammaproteobacteria bacterium]